MAHKNEKAEGEENNTTIDLETTFKRYNVEDVYRSMPLSRSHGSSTMNNDNDNDGDVGVEYANNNNNNNNNWDKLNIIEPFPNYVLQNNKGGKKNETAIEIGVDIINMGVGVIDMNSKNTDRDNKNTDMNMDMDMYIHMSMPTRTQEEQETIKTELETCEYPVWDGGIDRFMNWLAKPNLSPSSLMSLTKGILEKLNRENALFMTAGHMNDHEYNDNNNNKNNTDTKVLTYVCCRNLLLCRVVLSEYQISEFQIGVYLDKNGDCLLDVQELSGEHFTFAHFLHVFKSQLEQQGIIDASTPTPEFSDNYGISMEINLDSFDEM